MNKFLSVVIISFSLVCSSSAFATDDWVKALGIALVVNAVSGGNSFGGNRYGGDNYRSSRQHQSQTQAVYVNTGGNNDNYSGSRSRRHNDYDRDYDRPRRVSVRTHESHESGGSEYWKERRRGRHGSSSRGGKNYWRDSYSRSTRRD